MRKLRLLLPDLGPGPGAPGGSHARVHSRGNPERGLPSTELHLVNPKFGRGRPGYEVKFALVSCPDPSGQRYLHFCNSEWKGLKLLLNFDLAK